MDKRGAVAKVVIGALISLVVLILIIVGISLLKSKVGERTPNPSEISSQKFGDAIGMPSFNFVSYIVGGVPEGLISDIGKVSATIVIFVIFLLLAFTFGDIMVRFSFFSDAVSWVVGFGLALIAANFRLVMWFSVWSFGIVAGAGVVAVVIGILAPLVIFAVLNILLVKQLGHWKTRQDIEAKGRAVEKGAGAVASAIKGFKTSAKAFEEG